MGYLTFKRLGQLSEIHNLSSKILISAEFKRNRQTYKAKRLLDSMGKTRRLAPKS